MRAFIVNAWAPHGEIPLATNVPLPVVKLGEVLVDVYSAGLNFFDVCLKFASIHIRY